MKISIIKGDISKTPAEIIVNSSNKYLLGGGGSDGAIHRAAGVGLVKECKEIRDKYYPNGLPAGEIIVTKAYNLPARYVIHTVGPVYNRQDINLLANCYLNALNKAEEMKMESIVFPAIACGAFGVPVEMSARIVKEVLDNFIPKFLKEIKLVLFKEEDLIIYKNRFNIEEAPKWQ